MESENDVYVQPMSFCGLQREVRGWSERNFGAGTEEIRVFRTLSGIAEELGELNHAMLKQSQQIRGSFAAHEAAGKDAVGDMLVYVADFCNRKGWSLQSIVEETWDAVKQRDWTKNKADGSPT